MIMIVGKLPLVTKWSDRPSLMQIILTMMHFYQIFTNLSTKPLTITTISLFPGGRGVEVADASNFSTTERWPKRDLGDSHLPFHINSMMMMMTKSIAMSIKTSTHHITQLLDMWSILIMWSKNYKYNVWVGAPGVLYFLKAMINSIQISKVYFSKVYPVHASSKLCQFLHPHRSHNWAMLTIHLAVRRGEKSGQRASHRWFYNFPNFLPFSPSFLPLLAFSLTQHVSSSGGLC